MFITRAAVYLETGRNMQSRVLDLFGFAPLGFEKFRAREDVAALRLVIKFAAIAPLHVAIFSPGHGRERGCGKLFQLRRRGREVFRFAPLGFEKSHGERVW